MIESDRDYTEQAIDILNSNFSRNNLQLMQWKRDEGTIDNEEVIVLQYTFVIGKTSPDSGKHQPVKSIDMAFIKLAEEKRK